MHPGESCLLQIGCCVLSFVGCPVPVPPEGVLFHIGDNVTEIYHDQELSYTCGKGFDSAFNDTSQSFPTIQCVGGIWEGDNPFCEGIQMIQDHLTVFHCSHDCLLG